MASIGRYGRPLGVKNRTPRSVSMAHDGKYPGTMRGCQGADRSDPEDGALLAAHRSPGHQRSRAILPSHDIPATGETLPRLGAHLVCWFGWHAFYPDAELYRPRR